MRYIHSEETLNVPEGGKSNLKFAEKCARNRFFVKSWRQIPPEGQRKRRIANSENSQGHHQVSTSHRHWAKRFVIIQGRQAGIGGGGADEESFQEHSRRTFRIWQSTSPSQRRMSSISSFTTVPARTSLPSEQSELSSTT